MATTDLFYSEGFENASPVYFDIKGDFIQTSAVVKSGVNSFTNRDINDRGVSYFTMKVTVPYESGRTVNWSEVAFDYRLSSESGFDKFEVYRNGIQVLSKSGEVAWTTHTISNLPAGDHVFLFLYKKDSVVSSGLDSVFIDDIRFSYNSTDSAPVHSDSIDGGGNHADFYN